MDKIALILDDEPTICMLLVEILKMNEIHSVTADSVGSARLLLNNWKPSLAFIDHRLPDGYGLEFIPELRKLCKNARIILMTAQENFNKETIKQYGADFFLSKPFSINRILELSTLHEHNF
jgi:DNA-binding response OmpR family regulator